MAEMETKQARGTVREIETDWKVYDNCAAGDFLGRFARGDVRREMPTSVWAFPYTPHTALVQISSLALVSGGAAVWYVSCRGEVLYRLDGRGGRVAL